MKRIFFVRLVWLLTIFCFGSGLKGPNVCREYHTHSEYCCAEHEEKNGKCEACEVGYTSKNGNPCEPCKQSYYGPRCTHNCNCSKTQKCDNVQGCIEIVNKTNGATTSSLNNNTRKETGRVSPPIVSTDFNDGFTSGSNIQHQVDKALTIEMVLFLYSVTVLIFLITAFILIHGVKFIKKKYRQNTSNNKTNNVESGQV